MAENSLIAWTDHTFNAWMGCSKISAGCQNCYAEKLVTQRMGRPNLWGFNGDRQKTKGPWLDTLRFNKLAAAGKVGVLGEGMPLLVFLGSLMDWAEDRRDLDPIREQMWQLIRDCPHLHFQMLTKRPHNIKRFLPPDWGNGYPNVWIGTTIEDMRVANRADFLRDIPARIRFVSYEPALGPLDDLDLTGIDWVIYGGESGPGFRPEDKEWARVMHRKCAEANVAFFHKQSNGIRTEMGIQLDGQIVRQFPLLTPLEEFLKEDGRTIPKGVFNPGTEVKITAAVQYQGDST